MPRGDGRYLIEKDILTDVSTHVVLQRIRFVALAGTALDYRLFALLAPHLNNRGDGNTAWTGDYKGVPMLFAERNGYALAMACSTPWRARSVGFVGLLGRMAAAARTRTDWRAPTTARRTGTSRSPERWTCRVRFRNS